MTVEYNLSDSGIHEFIFNKADRRAVDEYIDYLKVILPASDNNTPWLSVLDMSSSGMVPIRYALSVVTDFSKPYLEKRANRTIVIHNAGSLGEMTRVMVNPINDKVRFVTPDQVDDALDWLMEG